MRWFRSNRRFGACCALIALTVQLVLSFGHVHVDGLVPSAVSLHLANVVGAPLPAALPDGQTAPVKKPPGLADDFCAICSLIHLAGTLMPSASSQLPVPKALRALRLDSRADRKLAASQPFFFQARAPPLA